MEADLHNVPLYPYKISDRIPAIVTFKQGSVIYIYVHIYVCSIVLHLLFSFSS